MVLLNNNYYGVIWDFDGTMIDSMPTHFHAWQKFMAIYNLEFSEEDFWATSGKSAEEILRFYFKDVSETELTNLANLKNGMYREAAENIGIPFSTGAENLILELHRAGYKQAIGSGSPRKNLELSYLQHPQLKKYFEVAVMAEDTSHSKPDPEVFLTAANHLGIAPQNCLVLEDGLLGIEAARQAGMVSIAVIAIGQDEEEFRKRGAVRVIRNLKDLKESDITNLLTQ